MSRRVVRIPRGELAALISRFGNEGTPPQYIHSNPFVRELMWRRLDGLLALSNPPARNRVLDFGGGNGVLVSTLSTMFQEVVCVDRQPEMVREVVQSKRLGNVKILDQDLSSLEIPTGYFDSIVAADVLEHLPDFHPIVHEFARILNKNGELLVSAPSENALYALARVLFGYKKPLDHYHDPDQIQNGISATLSPTHLKYFPAGLRQLSFFWLLRFRKT
jgi:SAM-dependent methyltransferase